MLEWGAPAWFLALFGLVAFAILVIRRVAIDLRARRAFAPRLLWDRMRVGGDEGETLLRATLILLGLAFLIVGLADPRNGVAAKRGDAHEAPRLLILLDTSKSMLAADTGYGGLAHGGDGGTTRFDAARNVVRDLLADLRGWNVGLMVFAGEPLVLCPITSDQAAAVTLLERARAGDPAMKGGTHIENALRAGAALLGTGRGSILLVTDGEELAGSSLAIARQLASRNTPVFTVGVGSPRGSPIRLPSGEAVAWRGGTVLTSRNDELLEKVASLTRGKYWRPSPIDSGGMVQTVTGHQIAGGLSTPVGHRQPGPSRKAWPVALGLLLLAAEAFWGTRRAVKAVAGKVLDLWLGKRRKHTVARRPMPRAAIGAAAGVLLAGWTWPAIPYVQKGLDAYRKGDATRSAAFFEEAAKRDKAPEIQYDLGNAYHLGGNYRQSQATYRAALEKLPPRSRLAEHAHYNQGNTQFRMGDYRGAIGSYRKALAIDPRDADARHNLALAEERLANDGSPKKGGGRPIAGIPEEGAVPMPDPDEAALALASLEADERQRQAAAARWTERADPAAQTPSQLARRLLREAEQSVTRQLEKDW